jgi:hypothetical protein
MGSSVRHRITVCFQFLLLHKRSVPNDFPMQADESLGYTHLVEGSGSILQTNEELDVMIKSLYLRPLLIQFTDDHSIR